MGRKKQELINNQPMRKLREYRTIEELEKEFFPDSFKKREFTEITDSHELGIALAHESLEMIKVRLQEKKGV
jgi:hypothetical protein